MTDKVYKDVLPCGVLTTQTGTEYWLIKPYPLLKDWEQDRQQRFLVVPKIPFHYNGNIAYFSYQRHIIITDPDIEYRYETDVANTIKVWDLGTWDVVEKLPNPELDDYITTEEAELPELSLEELDSLIGVN